MQKLYLDLDTIHNCTSYMDKQDFLEEMGIATTTIQVGLHSLDDDELKMFNEDPAMFLELWEPDKAPGMVAVEKSYMPEDAMLIAIFAPLGNGLLAVNASEEVLAVTREIDLVD